MSRLFETSTLDISTKVKILSISSCESMLKITKISLALLRHGNLIKRRKLLVYVTFNFFKAVLVRSNYTGAKYNAEQYILNK